MTPTARFEEDLKADSLDTVCARLLHAMMKHGVNSRPYHYRIYACGEACRFVRIAAAVTALMLIQLSADAGRDDDGPGRQVRI